MKKLTLLIALVLLSLQGIAQTRVIDPVGSGTTAGLGGGAVGANQQTTTPTTTVPQPDSTFGMDPNNQQRMETDPYNQQRMEEKSNFVGGSMGGADTTPQSVPPTKPKNIPSPTGVGTGAPTTY